MAPLHFCLLFFFVLAFQGETHAVFIVSEAMEIIELAQKVITALAKVWDLVDQDVEFKDLPAAILESTENNLFKKIDAINSKLEDQATKLRNIGTLSAQSMTILESLPDTIRMELRLNDLLDYCTRIDTIYQRMQDYGIEQKVYERLTLEDFARSVVSHDPSSVISLMERIHAFVVSNGRGISDTGLFDLLATAMQDSNTDMICNIKQSPQQVLYSMYSTIALTELKGYTMIQFSYMLLRLYGKGNFKKEVEVIRTRYEDRANKTVRAIGNALQGVSRDLWMCDPKNLHVEGETYEQITNLLQGYIQNEKGLDKDGSCLDECSAHSFTTNPKCEEKLCRIQRKCSGKVVDCQTVHSELTICKADVDSSRRYDYIQLGNDRVLGKKNICKSKTTKVTSWKSYLFWECSYCFCLCAEDRPTSDRYFNMKSVMSDITNHKVVTGLRFVKNNRIFHLQIQEGQLLPRLNINSSTVSWKPIENYKITDRKIYDNQEFHTITWENRIVDLDDLEAEDGYVLTGVRFKEVGTHLNFEIYTTKFDFETGKLKPETSKWSNNENTEITDDYRTQVHLTRPDIPTRSTTHSLPTSHSNQFIQFTNSDIDKDAAQTTVPFLDAQKVESLEPVPLSGAGIFHKGTSGFGGFISPKIITYDVSRHLKVGFPPKELH